MKRPSRLRIVGHLCKAACKAKACENLMIGCSVCPLRAGIPLAARRELCLRALHFSAPPPGPADEVEVFELLLDILEHIEETCGWGEE